MSFSFLNDIQEQLEGSYRFDAPLANTSWFKVGGKADLLFKPAHQDDLVLFLQNLPTDMPLTVLGASSNIIIRDGGIRGVTIKLGKTFSFIKKTHPLKITAGAFSLDVNVAQFCAQEGLAGLDFLSGIPGTIGGAIKMNAGAYGTEIKDVLDTATLVTRTGEIKHVTANDLDMGYRHTNLADDEIVLEASLQASHTEEPNVLLSQIAQIKQRRQDTQPITEKTSGSTFANPTQKECDALNLPLMKAWEMIQKSQADQIQIGGAMMSPKHRNFMINTGTASASDLEDLGEAVRDKVFETFGYRLRWEVKRIGERL